MLFFRIIISEKNVFFCFLFFFWGGYIQISFYSFSSFQFWCLKCISLRLSDFTIISAQGVVWKPWLIFTPSPNIYSFLVTLVAKEHLSYFRLTLFIQKCHEWLSFPPFSCKSYKNCHLIKGFFFPCYSFLVILCLKWFQLLSTENQYHSFGIVFHSCTEKKNNLIFMKEISGFSFWF